MTIQTTALNPRYVYVQPTMPTDTTIGKLWYNTSNNILYTSDGTTYNEMKTDLTPLYNGLALAQLQMLYFANQNALTPNTPSNFKGDVYTDNDGWLNTIDTTNTTAVFMSDYYASLEIVYSNPSEVSTTSTSYVVVKTFNVDKNIYYIISEIRNEITSNTYLKVRFTDAEGSWETEETSTASSSFVSRTLYNPYPERKPTTVEIMLRTTNSDRTAYERNTKLFGPPAATQIVQTKPQSIQSGFQRFVIFATEETPGTSSVTYDVSFDGGTNYQTGLVSSQIYEIENPGTSLILKQNLHPGENDELAKTYDWGILLI